MLFCFLDISSPQFTPSPNRNHAQLKTAFNLFCFVLFLFFHFPEKRQLTFFCSMTSSRTSPTFISDSWFSLQNDKGPSFGCTPRHWGSIQKRDPQVLSLGLQKANGRGSVSAFVLGCRLLSLTTTSPQNILIFVAEYSKKKKKKFLII